MPNMYSLSNKHEHDSALLSHPSPFPPTPKSYVKEPSSSPSSSSSSLFRDNASLILPFSVDAQSANRDEQVRQVAIQICPFFREDHENSVPVVDDDSSSVDKAVAMPGNKKTVPVVKPLLGGLSNELFIVSDPSSPSSHSVLVRIHPPGGEEDEVAVVDRELENRLVAWLSKENMAPIFYGRFQNGRVEELYPNVVPLSAKEMVAYGPKIAAALADFHSLDAPSDILPKPTLVPDRFHIVDQWVEAIQDSTSPHVALLERLSKEWMWLRAQLLTGPPSPAAASARSKVQAKALQFIRQIVLTHMDAQSLNILKDSQASNGEGKIRLIDFEYAGWNHRAADLANTFCEHCDMNNLCADYAAEYPTDSVQDVFLKTYVQRSHSPALTVEESEWPEFLATLRSEIGRFTLLSHLGWAAWSVVMVNEGSAIDFDYIAYAQHRMDGYELGKKCFFSVKDDVSSSC